MENHPHSTQTSRVAEVFEQLANDHPNGIVSFDAEDVNHRGDEHRVASVGGWFLRGTADNPEMDIMWNPTKVHDVVRGANRMAMKLGFIEASANRPWLQAEDYYGNRPWLWGHSGLFNNRDMSTGGLMFCDARAYGARKGDTLPLKALAKHWRGVTDRTRRIEKERARSGRSFDEVESTFQESTWEPWAQAA